MVSKFDCVFYALLPGLRVLFFFFFNDTATTEIYTLSLHDALPIFPITSLVPGLRNDLFHLLLITFAFSALGQFFSPAEAAAIPTLLPRRALLTANSMVRSEEHTSELQSQSNLVCRLLLEKKKAARHPHGSPVVPRAPLRSRRRLWPVGLPVARRRSATQARAGELHGISALPGPAAECARALARHGDVRHAVLGVRDHRAQLSRHRPDRGCTAGPGGGRSQHRAGRGGRRDGDLRRHRAGSGARGVHPSTAQLLGGRLRSGADRQHAGEVRAADAARPGRRRTGVGGGTGR